ncbi:MAG TPA: alpha/beta hydrolase [Burkholderiales bacterium]
MSKVFRDYTQAELDAQYEQRTLVPQADAIIARFATASDEVRRRIGEPRTERYGPSALELLDVYGNSKNKAFIFVHGGAWRRESRRGSAYAAEPVVRAGASFIALGFAALPSVTLAEMAGQVRRGIEWVLHNVSKKVVVFGHSSGAHLAACALTRILGIEKAMLVSGLYDLQPVRLSARNGYVKLDEKLEDEFSPIRHVSRIRCPVTVAWAEKDADEFRRQSREFAEKTLARNFEVKGVNHFEIVETLADPASPVCRAALTMLQ